MYDASYVVQRARVNEVGKDRERGEVQSVDVVDEVRKRRIKGWRLWGERKGTRANDRVFDKSRESRSQKRIYPSFEEGSK